MSQAGKLRDGTILSDIETLTGDFGGAVSPNAAFNLNILGGTNVTVTSNPGTNTLTINQSGGQEGTGQTIGAVTADVITFALGATPGTYSMGVRIAAFESTTPAGAGYKIKAGIRTTGAAGFVIGLIATDTFEDAALIPASVALLVVGNDAVVRVTGTAGLTLQWTAELDSTFAS